MFLSIPIIIHQNDNSLPILDHVVIWQYPKVFREAILNLDYLSSVFTTLINLDQNTIIYFTTKLLTCLRMSTTVPNGTTEAPKFNPKQNPHYSFI